MLSRTLFKNMVAAVMLEAYDCCPVADREVAVMQFTKFGTLRSVWVARNPPGFGELCPLAAAPVVAFLYFALGLAWDPCQTLTQTKRLICTTMVGLRPSLVT